MRELPRQIREALAVCVISFVATPSCFYVQMVEKIPQLRHMMRYIEHQLSPLPEIPANEIVTGLEIAVFLFDERESPSWFRAIVRNPIPSISLARVSISLFKKNLVKVWNLN